MSELPANWACVPLRDLGVWKGGGTPSKANAAYWSGTIPWVSPKDMKTAIIRDTVDFISEEAIENSAVSLVPPSSILIVTRSGILAHSLPVAINELPVTINQDLKALVPLDGLLPQFLVYALNAHERDILSGCVKDGTTVHSINTSELRDFTLPIAPLHEQRRIVAKIEELFSELDASAENLMRARAQLKTYRQALLKAAFEGKFTADWRAANAGWLEHAEKLLSRIRTVRDARDARGVKEWEIALAKWRARGEVGDRPSKRRRQDDPIPFEPGELDTICNIPQSWTWVRPSDIASDKSHSIGIGPFGSSLKVSDYREDGVPLIFVKNITKNDFSLDLKYIDLQKFEKLRAHVVYPNDILITKMGDPPGDCAIYPYSSAVAVITADCLKFRVWDDFVNKKFVAYMLQSIHVQRQLGLRTRGVAQKKISVERFKTIALPLPSIEEQNEIAAKLDTLCSVIENQVQSIDYTLAKISALRHSILKKAFSGQLVPQDPSDQSASALLARLHCQSSESNSRSKTRRKQTA